MQRGVDGRSTNDKLHAQSTNDKLHARLHAPQHAQQMLCNPTVQIHPYEGASRAHRAVCQVHQPRLGHAHNPNATPTLSQLTLKTPDSVGRRP